MKLKRLLALLFVISAIIAPGILLAQQVTVSGQITDSKTSQPLEGATIKVKNGKATAVSDADGRFTLKAPSSESIISVTYVGYTVYETKAGNGNLSIKLESLNTDLNEVVIVGYGTQKKAHLTGAIASIKGSEVEDLPVSNLGAALRGRLLGLAVGGGTARPGSQASLTIRNPISLAKDGGNNDPLYIIDDVIQVTAQGLNDPTLFNSLDPSEVESISILKDGAAAVYGSRAANGAIIVRTKRGKSGKPRISYSGSFATNDEVYRTKMMSAYELARYINIVNGPYGANITNPGEDDFFSQDELDYFKTIDYDWLDQAWKAGSNTRHTLNISGGSDKASYYAGGSYYTQDGNMGPLDYDKWTYRAGVDATVAAGLKVGLQIAGNQEKSSSVNSKIGGENVENDYRNLLLTPHYIPPYIDGLPVKLPGSFGNNVQSYHFFELNKLNNYIHDDQSTLSMNAYVEYEAPFLKGLKARVSYARNRTSSRNDRIGTSYMLYTFNNMQGTNGHIYDGATDPEGKSVENDGRVRFSSINSTLRQANFTLTYAKQFGQHNISALFSVERSEAESSQEDVYKEDPSPLTNGQFNTAFGAIDGRTFAYEGGNLGYIGRVNYNYAGKYLAEFLFRSDASTKFAPENYWGKFYSLSGGWIISEEKFFKARAVDFLKLRYSVGLLGKDDTKAWQWRQRYTFQNGKGAVFGDDSNPAGIGMKMEASPNRDATWSDDFKQNLGIDARFLKNRLSTTIELFYNHSTNMLLEKTGNVPVTVGGSIASQNFGAMDFFGYELGIGWNSTAGKDFTYGIDARFTWYDDKVKKGNFNDFDVQFPWNARPGQSRDNGQWGYDYLGMFKSQEEIDAFISKYHITSMFGTDPADFRPGMLYYKDIRGEIQPDGTFAAPDGIIDNNDQVRLSKKASNHYGIGMTLRAGYKGINFECVIAGSFGGWNEMDARDLLETDISDLFKNGPAYWANIYDPILDPTGKYPNPYYEDVNLNPTSDFWKVHSLKLRMVTANLNYSLPKRITDRLRITSARFVLSALNPLNLYNPFDYKDPDSGWNNYPVLRTLSIGVNVTL